MSITIDNIFGQNTDYVVNFNDKKIINEILREKYKKIDDDGNEYFDDTGSLKYLRIGDYYMNEAQTFSKNLSILGNKLFSDSRAVDEHYKFIKKNDINIEELIDAYDFIDYDTRRGSHDFNLYDDDVILFSNATNDSDGNGHVLFIRKYEGDSDDLRLYYAYDTDKYISIDDYMFCFYSENGDYLITHTEPNNDGIYLYVYELSEPYKISDLEDYKYKTYIESNKILPNPMVSIIQEGTLDNNKIFIFDNYYVETGDNFNLDDKVEVKINDKYFINKVKNRDFIGISRMINDNGEINPILKTDRYNTLRYNLNSKVLSFRDDFDIDNDIIYFHHRVVESYLDFLGNEIKIEQRSEAYGVHRVV